MLHTYFNSYVIFVTVQVADCVLLMSLDKADSIPVDTHMFQIAAANFLPHLKGRKSLTEKIYVEVAGHFRELYGDYAGWAHSVSHKIINNELIR